MDYHDITVQLERLRGRNNAARREACVALESALDLPQRAIAALERASLDPDPVVANAARHALGAHERGAVEPDSTPDALLCLRPFQRGQSR
jgi:hypothetical protein